MLFLVITHHPVEGREESLLPVSLSDLQIFLDAATDRGRKILAVARLSNQEGIGGKSGPERRRGRTEPAGGLALRN